MQHRFIHRILVCEFITGGGLNRADLPKGLVLEGQLMRDALLHDLAALPYQVVTTVDSRLVAPVAASQVHLVGATDCPWQLWAQLMADVDAVWLIAPETDGLLEKLTAMAEALGKYNLGCSAESVALTADKRATCQLLQTKHIQTIPTFTADEVPEEASPDWVIKPVDGAGCEETHIVSDIKTWLNEREPSALSGLVFQPYQAGVAASISCVMHQGRAVVLSSNQQLIDIRAQAIHYQGSVLNGLSRYWQAFEQLSKRIAQILPTLHGYVGIDVIVNEQDNQAPELFVVEINPRLTTSYVGMAQALAANPAAVIMQYLQGVPLLPDLKRNVVNVYTHAS